VTGRDEENGDVNKTRTATDCAGMAVAGLQECFPPAILLEIKVNYCCCLLSSFCLVEKVLFLLRINTPAVRNVAVIVTVAVTLIIFIREIHAPNLCQKLVSLSRF
jgi:hypothetical protein